MNSDLIFRQTQTPTPPPASPRCLPCPPSPLRCGQPTGLPTLRSTPPIPNPLPTALPAPPTPPSASPSPALSRRLRGPSRTTRQRPRGWGKGVCVGGGVFVTTSSVKAPGHRGGGGISLRKAGTTRLTLTRWRRRAELSTGGTRSSWALGARPTLRDTREAETFLRRLRNSGRPRRG